ncbi:MAG: siderophore-interacting protein [Geitlerinemataceae cyanobacterium]
MSKSKYRTITVKRSEKITPNMQRVAFSGDDLADFPADYEGGYVRLYFSDRGEAIAEESQLQASSNFPRVYTVRGFDRAASELTIDFSLHGKKNGPGATWANASKPGERILMAGPGMSKRVNNQADWFLFVGDMAGLPALSSSLEQLPDTARGYAAIEVMSEADRQELKVPAGIDVKWIVNDRPGENTDVLTNEIKSINWDSGKPFIWVACEFNSMKKVRQYLNDERNVDRDNLYISSYWKFGRTDEEHRIDKRQDANVPFPLKMIWGIQAQCKKLGWF